MSIRKLLERASGFSQTKSVINATTANKAITSALTSNLAKCDQNANIVQTLNSCQSANGINVASVTQSTNAALWSACTQNVSTKNDIATAITNAIKAEATAGNPGGAGLLFNAGSNNEADVTTGITNDIESTIKNTTGISCDRNASITDTVNLCGSGVNIGNVTQTGTIAMTGDCSQISDAINSLSTSLANSITASASSGSELDAIIAVVVMIIVIGIIIGIYYSMGGKGGGQKLARQYMKSQDRRGNMGYAKFRGIEGEGEKHIDEKLATKETITKKSIGGECLNLKYDW